MDKDHTMANIITVARFPLLFIYLGILYYGNQTLMFWNVLLIFVIFNLDSLDGWVARKLNETSLLGSVLDIATDRTLEYVLWVAYAHMGLIPVLVPIIVIIRGTSVDAVRSVRLKSGLSAFDQTQSSLSKFLVSSRFMRAFYGIAKGATASFLTLSLALQSSSAPWPNFVYKTGMVFTWTSVCLCIIRGLPVLIEGIKEIQSDPI